MGCGASKTQADKPDEPQQQQQPREEFVPPDDFPTPKVLAEWQDEFVQIERENLQQTGNDEQPNKQETSLDDGGQQTLPQPPDKRKKEIFNREDYAYIREGVVKAPNKLAVSSLSSLAEHIETLSQDVLGQLYAAFCWVVFVSQNLYEVGLDPEPANTTTLYKILLAHAGCGTFNEVFVNLCRELGFTVKEVKGYKKNVTSHQIVVSEEWSWPAVLLNNTWRFIDVDFAASVLKNQLKALNEQNYHQYEECTIININEDCEFYFLTDPDEWVFSHCAIDMEWQMLARPVKYEEFKQMAHLTEAFFTMGFTDIVEAKGIIVTEKGEAKLDLTLDEEKYIKLDYDLKKISGSEILSEVKGEDLKRLITLTNENHHKIMDIAFIEIGRYWLNIWAIDLAADSSFKKLLGQWFIECKEPTFTWEPNPQGQAIEFGQSSDMDYTGLRIISITNIDGLAHVRFESTSQKIFEFMHSVESDKVKKSKLRQYMRHYVHKKEGGVIIVFPEYGKYILNTFVRDKGSTKRFKHVCSLLLNSNVGHADLTPFPPSANSKIGYLMEKSDRFPFIANSHIVPYFKAEAPVTLKFHSKQRYDIMLYCDIRKRNGQEDITNYTWIHTVQTADYFETNIEVRFPYAGMFNLSIFARKAMAKSMIYREIYKYIIMVDHIESNCIPFPTAKDNWDPQFVLISPKDGYLLEQGDVDFSVKVNDVSEVLVFHSNSSLYQNLHDTDQSHDGRIKTLNGGNDLIVSAQFIKGKKMSSLLEYLVLTEEEWTSFKDEQQLQQRNANLRLAEINTRLQDEKNDANRRNDQRLQLEQRLSEEFEAQKNELFERETRLQQEFQEDFNEQLARNEELKEPMDEAKTNKVVRKEIKLILEAYDSEIRRRRRLYRDMVSQITRQKLREAIQQRNYKKLQRAIAEYHSQHLPPDDPDIVTAERLLDILTLQQELIDAISQKDLDALISLVDDVTVKGYHNALQKEVAEAQNMIKSMDKMEGLKYYVIGMQKSLMSELKSYTSPPPAVHSVMKAALLLLGEDESTTAEWSKCAMMCNPYGTEGLHWRLQLLNIQDLHPEIVARSKEIIDSLQFSKVQKVSPGATTFYVWASGIIDEYESVTEQDLNNIQPANIDRQRELLEKLPLTLTGPDTFTH